jgi:hypothetical protein
MIECELTTCAWSWKTAFKAVSYTWRQPKPCKKILVNGHSVSVRQNLWNLLYELRLAKETSLLWIDALCINQSNVSERNTPVPLMSMIYRGAKTVLAWLGWLPNGNTRAVEFIADAGRGGIWDLSTYEWKVQFVDGGEGMLGTGSTGEHLLSFVIGHTGQGSGSFRSYSSLAKLNCIAGRGTSTGFPLAGSATSLVRSSPKPLNYISLPEFGKVKLSRYAVNTR